jgi:hypothetical protein
VPFGVYNPGSGIRYASCFLLFLVYPSMLLSALEAEEAPPRWTPMALRHGLPEPR